MITTGTVLVLGAGASAPYGYPLGSGLSGVIGELTKPTGGISGVFGSDPTFEEFNRRFRESATPSIDSFLEANPTFVPLGKAAIAAALTIWGPNSEFGLNGPEDWYKYLWELVSSGASTPQEFERNRVRIVTYNYDRSLERYLERVTRAMYPQFAGAPVEETRAFLGRTLPVVHVHGHLGDSEGQVLALENRSAFINREFLTTAASGIRIIHEESPSAEYTMARRWIGEAERVYFIGFGYHPTNVSRLDLRSIAGGSPGDRWEHIRGTASGLLVAERERAAARLGLTVNHLVPETALQFLRNTARLD